jgi:hypothetical protein
MSVIKKSALAAIVVLGLAAAAATAAASATPAFPAFSGPPSKTNPVVKPGEIIYSGDGSQFFAGKKSSTKTAKLHWSVWNGTEGLGTGYNWINNCSPVCAQGKYSQFPITLKVFRPAKQGKYFIFTRIKVTYTGKKFGPKKTFTWTVSYKHGFFDIG